MRLVRLSINGRWGNYAAGEVRHFFVLLRKATPDKVVEASYAAEQLAEDASI